MRMKTQIAWLAAVVWLAVLTLAACGGNQPAAQPEDLAGDVEQNGAASEAETVQPEGQSSSAQPAVPFTEEVGGLSAARQPVQIQTTDGRTLEGYHYPSRFANVPAVVLMHWAPGSMADWDHIAVWLQNRVGELEAPPQAEGAIHDMGWFPAMPAEISFSVLVFNFGRYGASQYGGSRESMVLDAQAALEHAAALPGVDPHQITAIGASIGADGAVDACYLLNDAGEKGTCVGAFSLSPGNYLTQEFSYQQAAQMVNLSQYPVWCLAAENDGRSPDLCSSIADPLNRVFIYPGSYHGMELVDPEQLPSDPAVGLNALELVQEFLERAYHIQLNNLNLP